MIVIFGSKGMLGSYIYRYLTYKSYDVKCVNRENLDIYDSFTENNLIIKLKEIMKDNKPSHIINCIGDITKDRENTSKKYIINSYFPVILSKICKISGCILIHPTTDCVYSGNDSIYDENFLPDPIDDYGLSKFLGENIDACVIRSSIIGEEKGPQKRSLISWVMSNKNKTVNGYINHFWNGITCLEYAKIVERIIREKSDWVGIKHISSTYNSNNFITKHELVKIISKIYDLNVNVVKYKTVKKCDRTLKGDILCTTDLFDQIVEMKKFI